MKRLSTLLLLALVVIASAAQNAAAWKPLEKPLNFYLANDLGRNGYYDQKTVAATMGRMAEARSG